MYLFSLAKIIVETNCKLYEIANSDCCKCVINEFYKYEMNMKINNNNNSGGQQLMKMHLKQTTKHENYKCTTTYIHTCTMYAYIHFTKKLEK